MQSFDYFIILKENVVIYFIDDFMIVGFGKQLVVGGVRCFGGKYVIGVQEKYLKRIQGQLFQGSFWEISDLGCEEIFFLK